MVEVGVMKDILKRYREGKLAHAFLLETNDSNKCYQDVLELLKNINCPKEYRDNCEEECNICRLINNDSLPSLITIGPEGQFIKKDQILSLNPLPAHVFIFGDVAWDYGLEEDYIYAKELLQPLEDAGIQITLGLGNHDRRAAFFKVFPEYEQTTKVAGRAVSVVELPYADFVMLDTLSELPELPPRKSTNVFGELDEAQLEWLKKFLAESKRPVFLGAHHPLGDLPALTELITHSPIVAGFICGHLHIWSKKAYLLRPRKPEWMIPVVELPSTFYGDIGFATFRMDPQGAILSFSSQGFWWPEPAQNPPPQWEARQKDLANETCRFIFNKI